jgi:hypothetical protein
MSVTVRVDHPIAARVVSISKPPICEYLLDIVEVATTEGVCYAVNDCVDNPVKVDDIVTFVSYHSRLSSGVITTLLKRVDGTMAEISLSGWIHRGEREALLNTHEQ